MVQHPTMCIVIKHSFVSALLMRSSSSSVCWMVQLKNKRSTVFHADRTFISATTIISFVLIQCGSWHSVVVRSWIFIVSVMAITSCFVSLVIS